MRPNHWKAGCSWMGHSRKCCHWRTAPEQTPHVRREFCRGKWEALWDAAAKTQVKGHKSVQTAMALLPSCHHWSIQRTSTAPSRLPKLWQHIVLSTMHYFAFGLIKRRVESIISESKDDLLLSFLLSLLSVSLPLHSINYQLSFISFIETPNSINQRDLGENTTKYKQEAFNGIFAVYQLNYFQ